MKKTIVLGVTGGIAAFKAAQLTSNLIKKGYDVEVIMTKNATEFIAPLTFESLTKHNVMVSTFEKVADRSVKHVSIAKRADIFVIVPATANVIAKIVHGLADDMLTTTFLAATCPKVICPAMNTNMYENSIVQDNIAKLKRFGMQVIEPDVGPLACKDVGAGKMPSEDTLLDFILQEILFEKDLTGKNVLVTAGPTMEAIDPVRFISNHSTGKMGYAVAKTAARRGAKVTLVSGPVNLLPPRFVETVQIESAAQMYEEVIKRADEQDIIIKAAAVADYTPENTADEKIKKKDGDEMSIPLKRTKDILKTLGENKKEKQFICGFSMETQNMLENSKKKLEKKNVDMIVANNLKVEGAGFGTDTNIVTLITKDEVRKLPQMSKEDVAAAILDGIVEKIY